MNQQKFQSRCWAFDRLRTDQDQHCKSSEQKITLEFYEIEVNLVHNSADVDLEARTQNPPEGRVFGWARIPLVDNHQ